MDIAEVRHRIAVNAAGVAGLNTHAFLPDSVTVPCFYAGEADITYDRTFGNVDEALVTCRILASRADDESGQSFLDSFLGRGARSLKTAIESDRTLGGACLDLHVRKVQGYRRYVVGTDDYYGAEITVYVIGESEG